MLKTHQIIQTLRNGCLLATIAWLLTGCGAGTTSDIEAALQQATAISDSSETTATQTVTVSGQAVKGTLIGARVRLYAVRNVAGHAVPDMNTPLAETTTDETGHFTFTLNATSDSDVLVEVTPTDRSQMICDDVDGCFSNNTQVPFGKRMAAPKTLRLKAWRSRGSTKTISVSTLSHLIAERALQHQMGLTRDTVQIARNALASQLAVAPEVLDTVVEDVTQRIPTDSAALKASILNTALASLANQQQDMSAVIDLLANTFASQDNLPYRQHILTRVGEVAAKVIETHPDAANEDVVDWAIAVVDNAGTAQPNDDADSTETETTPGPNDNVSVVSDSDTPQNTTEAPANTPDSSIEVVVTDAPASNTDTTDNGSEASTPSVSDTDTTQTDTVAQSGETGSQSGMTEPQTQAGNTPADNTASDDTTTTDTRVVDNNTPDTTTQAPVIEPVSISLPPASQTVGYGQSVTLNVSATGTGPLKYQWKKDGIAIDGANQATLTIDKATRETAGTYTVVVTNDAGSVESTAATLTVEVDTTATLTWTIPDTREDGSALPLDEIAGYKIYKGTDASNLIEVAYIDDASQTLQQFTDLPPGRWYFAVSVVDINGLESELSNTGYKDIF